MLFSFSELLLKEADWKSRRNRHDLLVVHQEMLHVLEGPWWQNVWTVKSPSNHNFLHSSHGTNLHPETILNKFQNFPLNLSPHFHPNLIRPTPLTEYIHSHPKISIILPLNVIETSQPWNQNQIIKQAQASWDHLQSSQAIDQCEKWPGVMDSVRSFGVLLHWVSDWIWWGYWYADYTIWK